MKEVLVKDTVLEMLSQLIPNLCVDTCIQHEAVLDKLIQNCQTKKNEVVNRKKELRSERLEALKKEINYVVAEESTRTYDETSEDEYEMTEAKNGSCEFSSKEQADELVSLHQAKDNAYYYLHTVKWEGAGTYVITPETTQDHDCEYVFKFIYTKAE